MNRYRINPEMRQARGKKNWYYHCAAYSEHLAVLLLEVWEDPAECFRWQEQRDDCSGCAGKDVLSLSVSP